MRNVLTSWVLRLFILFLGLSFIPCAALAQQENLSIQNPLIRPPTLSSSDDGSSAQAGARSGAPASPRKTGRSHDTQNMGAEDSDSLRSKAAAHITQEDFNVQQQALNASVVPAPLQLMFDNMYVAAHAKGAIILRRYPGGSINVASSTQDASQSGKSTSGAYVAPNVSSGPRVLRFRENQVTNVNGYRLRARVDGFNVSVDWQNNSGNWANVFFGSVESSPEYARVPPSSSLIKPDAQAYRYLVPRLGSQYSSSNSTTDNTLPSSTSGGYATGTSSGTSSTSVFNN